VFQRNQQFEEQQQQQQQKKKTNRINQALSIFGFPSVLRIYLLLVVLVVFLKEFLFSRREIEKNETKQRK
jgi:uncharacterized membrane protein (DUF485 family)